MIFQTDDWDNCWPVVFMAANRYVQIFFERDDDLGEHGILSLLLWELRLFFSEVARTPSASDAHIAMQSYDYDCRADS